MSCLLVVELICPKCGAPVVWCNGGDVIYDFSSQFKATCPSCGYEKWEAEYGKEYRVCKVPGRKGVFEQALQHSCDAVRPRYGKSWDAI